MPSPPCSPPGFPVRPQSSPALSPRASLKKPVTSPCHDLAQPHPHLAAPGTPTSCPSLNHAISGAGKPLASHSSVRDCPAMPDTLALRPSSRMLGGTGHKER